MLPLSFIPPQAHAAPALIPGTVLANLIANNKVPDPNIGVFQRSIPDIYHAGTDFYTYRFSTLFERPANWEARAGCRAMLTLHGINYSARYASASAVLCTPR